MDEYKALKSRYHESHSTEDYKAMNTLYEKYGITRADQVKYGRIETMLSNQEHTDGLVIGSIPVKDVSDLLQKGDYAGVLSRIHSSLDESSLRSLVDFPPVKRNFEGYEKVQWLPHLAKSDSHKSSDLLLAASFGMYKEGDQYVIRADKDKFQKLISTPGIIDNYQRDLKAIERQSLDNVEGKDEQSSVNRKSASDLQNQTAINYDTLISNEESQGFSRQLKM